MNKADICKFKLSGQLDHDYAVEGIERFLNELV
jgi:hypothetical protein